MSIQIIDNFNIRTNKALDSRTKFATVEEALAGIPMIQRYVGLIVAIENDGEGNQALYWFEKGISDDDFIALNIKSSFSNWEWLDSELSSSNNNWEWVQFI